MKNFYLFLLLAAVFFVRFSAAAEKMQWDERGVLDCDGQKFDLLVRNKSWDIFRQLKLSPEDVRLEQKSDQETWYNYTIDEFKVTQRVIRLGENHYSVHYLAEAASPVVSKGIYVDAELPKTITANNAVSINGTAIPFPEMFHSEWDRAYPALRTIDLPLQSGVIHWKFAPENNNSCRLEDLRQWNLPTIDLRIFGTPPNGIISRYEFAAEVRFTPGGVPERKIPEKYVAREGADWRAFIPKQDVLKGSALDFTSLNDIDAPAGKYGPVVVRNGHFEFADRPGIPVRFYGANLCFSTNFIDHQTADMLAARLVRQGFNAVRFHHFDRDIIDRKSGNSFTFNPEMLDRFDYLAAALKKAGIYFTLDLYTIRPAAEGEYKTLPLDLSKADIQSYKTAVVFYPEARENLKRFVKALLTHKNPYTGMTWAEDPALNHVSIVNENNTVIMVENYAEPELREGIFAKFNEFCRQNNIVPSQSNRERFFLDSYAEYYRDMSSFLKGLGVRVPLTEYNFHSAPRYLAQRKNFDYVDVHSYWDHPTFGGAMWSLPMNFINESALFHRFRIPKMISPNRIFGKPFVTSEINFCYPNRYRAEGGLLIGAIAAYQGWDGVYYFDYADSAGRLENTNPGIAIFDIANDMTRLLPARIGTALFLRRDLQEAKDSYPIAVDPASPSGGNGRFPEPAEDLQFLGKIGMVEVQDGRLVTELPPNSRQIYNLDNVLKNPTLPVMNSEENAVTRECLTSDTGELFADFPRNCFYVITPRTEAAALPQNGEFNGRHFVCRARKGAANVAAITLDGKPFENTDRLLVLHVSDTKQKGSVYDSLAMNSLLDYGDRGTVIAENAVCDVELTLSPGNWRGYALDFDGARLGEILQGNGADGRIAFEANTFFKDQSVTFAYEITRLPENDIPKP